MKYCDLSLCIYLRVVLMSVYLARQCIVQKDLVFIYKS